MTSSSSTISKPGTNSTSRKTSEFYYSADDLCKIFKSARSVGVESLRLGEIRVQFLPKAKSARHILLNPDPSDEAENLLAAEELLREEQASTALLEDPALYEELQLKGLENADRRSN